MRKFLPKLSVRVASLALRARWILRGWTPGFVGAQDETGRRDVCPGATVPQQCYLSANLVNSKLNYFRGSALARLTYLILYILSVLNILAKVSGARHARSPWGFPRGVGQIAMYKVLASCRRGRNVKRAFLHNYTVVHEQ